MSKEKDCGIYKIQSKCKPGKFYIGSAVDCKSRKRQHLYDLRHNKHHNRIIQNHYNKYGEGDLNFSIVEQFDFMSMEHLVEKEQYYINTLKPTMNINIYATGSRLGVPHTPESCLKMSLSHQGQVSCNKGKKASLETIAKLRESHLGQPSSMKGKKHKPESILKMSIARKGKPSPRKGTHLTEEQKQNLREKNLGKKYSQETLDKKRATGRRNFFKRVYSIDGKKKCAYCGEYFDINCFIKHKRTYDNLHYYCDKCRKQKKRESKIKVKNNGGNISTNINKGAA